MSQMGSWLAGSSPSSAVLTLTGDSGGAVGPLLGNINILGTSGVTVTGDPGTNTLTIIGTTAFLNYTNVADPTYTVLVTDQFLSVDTTSTAVTLLFPNLPIPGQVFIIKDRNGNAATNNITVTTVAGLVNIDSAPTFVMNTAYQSCQIVGNSSWYEIF